jgi:hypothetical protein
MKTTPLAKAPKAQSPLLLRFHRLVDAFAKSDDERDFYLDRIEGFILYSDLDKGQKELDDLAIELEAEKARFVKLPKMTFYETKKFMEGFINEKVYDIDTKEKLLDVIQSKEARENFLEFIYDHLNELEKWQQYYVERMRIRIIEWLRLQEFVFVFEEDLDLPKTTMEKVKQHLFDAKVGKEVAGAREVLSQKAKTYYSNEALNPRPKRGRPPKQQIKIEIEPQLTGDIYTTVPPVCRMFLYLPDIVSASSVTFSSRYGTEAELLASLRGTTRVKVDTKLEALSQRLESLRQLSSRLSGIEDLVGEREGKLLKAVSQQEPASLASPDEEKKRGILDIVKGFLPRRKEKKLETDAPAQAPAVKKVTPLQSKKKR